ncbi:MAG: TetR/AcrR family transcriptional regulator [Thermoplasmata archaeon]|jgi:AcrR family transcriptional regulator|nr:TetR/AcrR family transcriptional regulator [Thermoplasmata archaeon]
MPKVVAGYKAQARERIIRAARTVFLRKGIAHATMDDVAREVGVSKGALYLYFRTKTQLLVQIQGQMRDEIVAEWDALLEEGDIAEGLADTLDRIFAGKADTSVWHGLVAASAGDPEVRAALELDHREDLKLMRRFLKRLQDRGRIPKIEDPDTVAEIVLMLLSGTAVRVMLGGRMGDARRKLVRSLRLILRV